MLFKKTPAHGSDAIDSLKIIDSDTPFAIREAFRTLYTNILYLPIEDKCKKLAITSAFPGEGKTYISINLALTLAQNSDDCKVLLVDMDMRKPRVTRLMKKFADRSERKDGLSEYLAGISATPNIIDTDIPNFSILFSGADAMNPAGLINSSKMSEFIKECEENYDYIIFDTPPVTVVTDAVLLVKHVNGYLVATRADYSNVNDLSDALDTLGKVEGQVLGIVLTDVEPKKGGKRFMQSKYGSYGDYYETK